MKHFPCKESIVVWVTVAGCAWIILNSLISVFGNGFLYHVQQPVPIADVSDHNVRLSFTRRALLSMDGNCGFEMHCSGVVWLLSHQSCPLEPGRRTFTLNLPIPRDARGPCIVIGTITYRPLGLLGPQITYLWQSEEFDFTGP